MNCLGKLQESQLKIFKDGLGVTELEARVLALEQRVLKYEDALMKLAEAIRLNSKNVVELSQCIARIVEIADQELARGSNKENVYH